MKKIGQVFESSLQIKILPIFCCQSRLNSGAAEMRGRPSTEAVQIRGPPKYGGRPNTGAAQTRGRPSTWSRPNTGGPPKIRGAAQNTGGHPNTGGRPKIGGSPKIGCRPNFGGPLKIRPPNLYPSKLQGIQICSKTYI